jgi:DNA-binding IclR family transcriptional regulator
MNSKGNAREPFCDEGFHDSESFRGYRLIQMLVEIGVVMRGQRGRYRLGLLLLSPSHNVTIAELLRNAGLTLLTDIAKALDLTVYLEVLKHGMVVYVSKVPF